MPTDKSSIGRMVVIAGIAAAVGGVSLSRAALPPVTDRAEHHLAPLPHRSTRTTSAAKGDRWEPMPPYSNERPVLSEHEAYEASLDALARWKPPLWGYLLPPRSAKPVGGTRVDGKIQDRFRRP